MYLLNDNNPVFVNIISFKFGLLFIVLAINIVFKIILHSMINYACIKFHIGVV